MNTLAGALVRAMNENDARIALTEARSAELTIELGQLRAAIEAVGDKVTFDSDPSDFRAALLALAEENRT